MKCTLRLLPAVLLIGWLWIGNGCESTDKSDSGMSASGEMAYCCFAAVIKKAMEQQYASTPDRDTDRCRFSLRLNRTTGPQHNQSTDR